MNIKQLGFKEYVWLFIIVLLSIGSMTSVGVLLYHLVFGMTEYTVGVFFIVLAFAGALVISVCNLPYDINL